MEARALHPRQLEAYRRMGPAAKLELAARMWTDARALKGAYLRQRHPDWTAAEIESRVREIFLHARS